MTENQIKEFIRLSDIFIEDCDRVASILKDAPEHKRECCNISYANHFKLDGDSVSWEGVEFWSYGGEEYHSGSFPAEYLTMTDEQLMEIVKQKIEKHEAEVKAEEEAKRAKAIEERRKEYEKLKKEFEQ